MPTPSILNRLRADHRRVLRDLATIERQHPHLAAPAAGRSAVSRGPARSARHPRPGTALVQELIDRLRRQFATHMVAEEESLFPALERALPESRASLGPLREDHAELRDLLESLAALIAAPESPERNWQFVVQWRDFAALLRIHVRKEEALVFGIAGRILTPAELSGVAALRFPGRPRPFRNPNQESRP